MSTIDFQPRGTALAAAGGLSLVVGLVLLGPAAAVATTTATPTATASSSSTPTAADSESASATESESATSEPTTPEPTRDDAAAPDDETAASTEESTPTPAESPTDEATDSDTSETSDSETDGPETSNSETPSGFTLSCPTTEVVAGESATAPVSAPSSVERLEVSSPVGTAGGEASIPGTDLTYTAPDPSTVDGTVTEVYTILATADDGSTERCEATIYIMPAESQDASATPSAPETTDGAEETSGAETSPTEDAGAEDFLPGAGQETPSPENSTSGTMPGSAASEDVLDTSLPVPGGPQPTTDGSSEPDEDAGQSPAPGPDTGPDDAGHSGPAQPDPPQSDPPQSRDHGAAPESQSGGDAQQGSGRASAPAAESSDAASSSAPESSAAGDADREPADVPVAVDRDSDDGLMLTSSSAGPIVAVVLTAVAVGAALLSVVGRRRAD